MNTKVFASCCEASLNEIFPSYSAFFMDNQVNHDVTQQPLRAALKTLTKNFQHEIKIYNEGIYVSELCKDLLYLTENTNKCEVSEMSILILQRLIWNSDSSSLLIASSYLN